MPRYLTLGLSMLIAGCGAKASKSDDPTLTFLFQFDNSYRTLVRCAVNGDSIKCDENTRSPIPTLGSFQVYSGIGNWGLLKLLQGADGCFEGDLGGSAASLDQLNQLDDIGASSTCRPVIRLADSAGAIQKEWGLPTSGRPQTANFSGHLEPMQTYQFLVRNTEGGDCKLPIRLKNEQQYSDASINEVQADFGSGFSLHYDTSIHVQGLRSVKGIPSNFTGVRRWTRHL